METTIKKCNCGNASGEAVANATIICTCGDSCPGSTCTCGCTCCA